MNWLIFAVVGFLILSAGDGHRKGFIKKSVGIVSIALTLFLTSAVSSYIMTFLKEKTKMHHVLQNTVASGDTELLEPFRMIGGYGQRISGGYHFEGGRLFDYLLSGQRFDTGNCILSGNRCQAACAPWTE